MAMPSRRPLARDTYRAVRRGEAGLTMDSTHQNFGAAAPFALGVEEELLLLNSDRRLLERGEEASSKPIPTKARWSGRSSRRWLSRTQTSPATRERRPPLSARSVESSSEPGGGSWALGYTRTRGRGRPASHQLLGVSRSRETCGVSFGRRSAANTSMSACLMRIQRYVRTTASAPTYPS